MFESIDKSIDYSNKIVNDLIDYSSELVLEVTPTTPRLLVSEALAMITVPERMQIIDKTPDSPQINVDLPKMRRAFGNVIKNAFDSMSPMGGKLTISCQDLGKDIAFVFNDTGEGMTSEIMLKIWSPLFTTKAKGMGFGLAICKRTVEAHNGKISLESQVKVGTTVRIELPLNFKVIP
jgi:signal transduction histidine kinase